MRRNILQLVVYFIIAAILKFVVRENIFSFEDLVINLIALLFAIDLTRDLFKNE